MDIVFRIPKKFEKHFNSDRFEDSLQRARVDIHKSIIGNKSVLSGKYEIETLDMLTEAFLNSTPLPQGHGRLIDVSKIDEDRIERDNPIIYLTVNGEYIEAVSLDYINNLPTIIEADKEDEKDE